MNTITTMNRNDAVVEMARHYVLNRAKHGGGPNLMLAEPSEPSDDIAQITDDAAKFIESIFARYVALKQRGATGNVVKQAHTKRCRGLRASSRTTPPDHHNCMSGYRRSRIIIRERRNPMKSP